jgi:hypothetical protein
MSFKQEEATSMRVRTAITLAALVFTAAAGNSQPAPNTIPAPSKWVNQHGSVLSIMSVNGGAFEGTYENKKAGTYCLNDPYIVTGKVDGDDIAFSVAFADRSDKTKNCFTVAHWSGTITGTVIDTNWSLAYAGTTGLSVWGGSDRFELQP